jgi:hypothetical protein
MSTISSVEFQTSQRLKNEFHKIKTTGMGEHLVSAVGGSVTAAISHFLSYSLGSGPPSGTQLFLFLFYLFYLWWSGARINFFFLRFGWRVGWGADVLKVRAQVGRSWLPLGEGFVHGLAANLVGWSLHGTRPPFIYF